MKIEGYKEGTKFKFSDGDDLTFKCKIIFEDHGYFDVLIDDQTIPERIGKKNFKKYIDNGQIRL